MSETNDVSLSDIDTAPTGLVPLGPVSPEAYEILIGKFTVVSDENFGLKSEIEILTKRVRTAEILDSLIKPYAEKAFAFMCAYCTFVGLILVLSGCSNSGFTQPPEVLSLMVGSTAVTVIGLVGMVLTGIFIGARKSGS